LSCVTGVGSQQIKMSDISALLEIKWHYVESAIKSQLTNQPNGISRNVIGE